MGGLARARTLSAKERSRIARRAARKRWASREAGILSIADIRTSVKKALIGRQAKALLFGSYARGEATPRSDVDILVIEKRLPKEAWLSEVSRLRREMGIEKGLDLIVMDERSFNKWKGEYGTVQHEAAREGVRLV